MNLIEDGKAAPPNMVSIGDVFAILFRRKWLMAITFLVVFGAVATATLLTPKRYEARMKILVKNERAEMVVTTESNSGPGYRNEVSETGINTEIELLDSKDLLERVVTKCGLDRLERSNSSPESEWRPVAIERAVIGLQRDLKISPVKKANIIRVDYSSTDPQQAASVLQQLAESYLEAHLKVHATPGTYEFFTTQASRYRDELSEAETKLTEFRRKNNIVMLERQTEETLQRAAGSQSALLQTEASIAEYKDRSADTRKQLAAASPRVITQSRTVPNQYSVDHLGSMLAELQNRRTQLLAKFRADDRVVQETDEEIANTQTALEKATKLAGVEQSTDVNPLHQALEIEMAKEQSELAGEEARRSTLVRQARGYQDQLMVLGNATSAYDNLMRNQKAAEENYLLYSQKMEEARIAESLDKQKIANVAIAEIPTKPYLPSKSNTSLYLAMGMFLACFLSLAVAFCCEYFANTIERSSDLELLTGLPLLASVSIDS